MSLVYAIADHFKEPDIRKIANLPANILLHWQAWLSINGYSIDGMEPEKNTLPPLPDIDNQYADVMRILKS